MCSTNETIEVTGTGEPLGPNGVGLQRYLAGWYFTETVGTSGATVTIRKGGISGEIVQTLDVDAAESVGMDYVNSVEGSDWHVTINGTGTIQGAIRGR